MSIKTESDIWRWQIYSELALELIQFGLKKGFHLSEILGYVSIQNKLIEALKSDLSNLNLAQFTRIFYNIVNNPVDHAFVRSENSLKEFIDYEGEAILKSFSLLRYVFTQERESAVESDTKPVHGPSPEDYDKMRLRDAKMNDEWVKEQKVAECVASQKRLEEDFAREEKKLIDEEKSVRNLLEFIKNDAYGSEEPLNEEVKIFNSI